MPQPSIAIAPVRSAAGLHTLCKLFRAYAATLDVDLAYQGFEAEMAAMPGKYAAPHGALLLAHGADGGVLGCVGLRPSGPAGICEMKRLYVCPEGRGQGVGQALVAAIIGAAGTIGYREMRLDTLPSMTAAQSLYGKAGFSVVAPYYDTPVAGTVFLGKSLQKELLF